MVRFSTRLLETPKINVVRQFCWKPQLLKVLLSLRILWSFGSLLTPGHQQEEGRSLDPSLASSEARVCSGEGEQEKIDVIGNQTPPSLGLAPKRGFSEDFDEGFDNMQS